jgi:hypothetical protein
MPQQCDVAETLAITQDDLERVRFAGEAGRSWEKIPKYMRPSVWQWLHFGTVPGNFLVGVLTSDLGKAVAYADDDNIVLLRAWWQFFYNYCPSGCFGSMAKVQTWAKHEGLSGRKAHYDAIQREAAAKEAAEEAAERAGA